MSFSPLTPFIAPSSDHFFFFFVISGSYPADKNVNLMMKQGESLSFLSKKKDDFTMVEIDLSAQVCFFLHIPPPLYVPPPLFINHSICFFIPPQTVPFLKSASDSIVMIDSYNYSNHVSGEILDFTVIFFFFFFFFFSVPSSHKCSL